MTDRRLDEQVPAIKGGAARFSALAGKAARRSQAFCGDGVHSAVAVRLVALPEGTTLGAAARGLAHHAFHVVAEPAVATEARRVIASGSHDEGSGGRDKH